MNSPLLKEQLEKSIDEYEKVDPPNPGGRLLKAIARYLCGYEKKIVPIHPVSKTQPHIPVTREQMEKFDEGFVPLVMFIRTTIHPHLGIFLSNSTLGNYFRDFPDLFEGCFYRKQPGRTEYLVHPQRLLQKLLHHSTPMIRNRVKEYLDHQKKQEVND